MSDIEIHPLPPFLPSNAKVLMLGSFPPPRARWKMDFYYPNFLNDMWRIFGLIWFNDKNHFLDLEAKSFQEAAIRSFLQDTGIAVYDTAVQIRRLQNNAADKYLQIIQAVDLESLLAEMPECAHILTTGDLATQTLLSLLPERTAAPTIGQSVQTECSGRRLHLHRLPSSSRAYPLALEKKATAYRSVFAEIFRPSENRFDA